MKNILLVLTFIFSMNYGFSEVQDSIKTIKEKGQSFVLHKIDKGETFYSICKRYGASPSTALKFNPSALDVIKTGETLKIPFGVEKTTSQEIIMEVNENIENIYHTVEKGETLYALSRKFRVSVSDIKSWNNLTEDAISEGQRVVVGKKNKSVLVEEQLKVDSIVLVDDKSKNVEVNTDLDIAPEIDVIKDVRETTFEELAEGSEVTESGFVKYISDSKIDQSRNYVLHPKAKVGTIIMITNPQNNKSVFARVLGPFNVADKSNEDIIMLITTNTAKKIGLKKSTEMLVKLSYTK